MGQPTSFRASDQTLEMLRDLQEWLGLGRTRAIEYCVRRTHAREAKERARLSKPVRAKKSRADA